MNEMTGVVTAVTQEEPAGDKYRQNFLLKCDGYDYAFEIYNRKCACPRVDDTVTVSYYLGKGREYKGRIYSNPHSVQKIVAA